MSGVVNGTLTRFNDGSIDVTPEYTPSQVRGDEGEHIQACPIALAGSLATPRCYTIMFDGERRACTFWRACVKQSNSTQRVDVGSEAVNLIERASATMRIGILCDCARRNRPAGC